MPRNTQSPPPSTNAPSCTRITPTPPPSSNPTLSTSSSLCIAALSRIRNTYLSMAPHHAADHSTWEDVLIDTACSIRLSGFIHPRHVQPAPGLPSTPPETSLGPPNMPEPRPPVRVCGRSPIPGRSHSRWYLYFVHLQQHASIEASMRMTYPVL